MTEQLSELNETPSTLSKLADIICFGPETQKAAEQLGYEIKHRLERPSLNALMDVLKS